MEKNLDSKGRWRNKIVAFRVSPEEAEQIDACVRLSGLSKQDYITKRLTDREIVVQGNPRVYKALRNQMAEIYEELKHLEKCSEENEAAALQLSLSGVSIKDDHDQLILHDVSFEMHKAEILGIAGISGNGQRELAEAIYGARKLQSGILSANEEDISSTDIAHRIRLGMRMVTEDPIRDNVVPTFSILENMALVGLDPIYRHGDMDWQAMRSQLQTHSEVKTLRRLR